MNNIVNEMKIFTLSFVALLLIVSFCNGNEQRKIAKARIDSCPGCSLNRLPEVRKFIYEDVPKYENVEWKKIGGAPPELIFLDENDKEVERFFLKAFNRDECNNLLISNGFKIKEEAKSNNEL